MSIHLPIMPKEIRPATHTRTIRSASTSLAPYVAPTNESSPTTSMQQRNAAIWSSADDDVLLQARASGLNWQPIANRYFPNKTPNACRKRHERLIERRHIEEWDHHRLEALAEEYLACRKQMWEILAQRVGERWAVVEAKCMEKGLKSLQITARTAHRKASAISQHRSAVGAFDGRSDGGISDHLSDSGIGIGSDAEMDIGDDTHISEHSHHHHPTGSSSGVQSLYSQHYQQPPAPHPQHHQQQSFSSSQDSENLSGHVHGKSSSWHAPESQYEASSSDPRPSTHAQALLSRSSDHARTRSLPQPLPLYQPPPPIATNHHHRRSVLDTEMTNSPDQDSYPSRRDSLASQSYQRRYSPESNNGRGGISIQSVLSN